MYIPGSQTKDFGAKNVALIAFFAVVLGALAWSQRPARVVSGNSGLSFNAQNTNVFVQNSGNQPAVLGANQVNQSLLNQFANIPVQTSQDTSKVALQNYADQLRAILSADSGSAKVVDDLKVLAAPVVLADYHRLKVAYYTLVFASDGGVNPDAQTLEDAIQQQLSQTQSYFQTSVGVNLP